MHMHAQQDYYYSYAIFWPTGNIITANKLSLHVTQSIKAWRVLAIQQPSIIIIIIGLAILLNVVWT